MDHLHQVHGVDVSWTHRPTVPREHAQSLPDGTTHVQAPGSTNGTQPDAKVDTPDQPAAIDSKVPKAQVTAQIVSTSPTKTSAVSEPATSTPQKPPSRRPSLLSRSTSNTEKQSPGDGARGTRRNSWISSLSSKFSPASPSAPQTSKSNANGTNAGPPAQTAKDHLPSSARSLEKAEHETEELQPYVPQKPKEANSSFFSSITRRLSSNTQSGGVAKSAENGGVCARRILNVDYNRERCLVPELDLAKLKRVSFSVDVEIAAAPRYKDDDSGACKQKKTRDRKVKEKAEGEALKHPEAAAETKDKSEAVNQSTDDAIATSQVQVPPDVKSDSANQDTDEKAQKKPRTEEEKQERKERKRRRAEENGQLPVELTADQAPPALTTSQASAPAPSGTVTPRAQDRPTTDPVRIYRRCCQLRESPILKRITEQLMSSNCTIPDDPGVVAELRLSGSRMQLADVFTLGDWLAIVPVKRLLLEDADLNDEGVRVILSGLLAAKKPEPTKRRNGTRQAPSGSPMGIIEKLTLKNNPRITKVGWKYIALFLYMCRSIKAVDVSMIEFPQSLPPPNGEARVKSSNAAGHQTDAGETFCKALSERLGGCTLEELTMAECGLRAPQIRKIVDGATMSGISRLGFAGNEIDDEAFDCILHFVRSGVCHALDLGSNDLRGRLGRLAEALTYRPDCPVWGLSLAGCNLDTESLRELFPSLHALQNFRFLDLSHNKDLFNGDICSLQLLRKYLPKLHNLKRIHLRDVGMTVKQAISLAEVLPEGPSLAHVTILENPLLSALANATDEQSQEEACALYASLTAAARVSKSIVCIDIDVPASDHGEIVKALAKQVVAYCLRNMERTMSQTLTMPLAATLSAPHGVEDARYVPMPDVLLHLVGNLGGDDSKVPDDGESAPDEDYIVGGNGLVKALQYFLSEEAIDIRRGSFPASGTSTPRLDSMQAGHEIKRKGKAKEVSKELLDSARKLRARLQPALVKEFTMGDEINYRRLSFLDDTLRGIIERFEDEYPETRPSLPSPQVPASLPSSLGSTADFGTLPSAEGTMASSFGPPSLDMSALSLDSEDEDRRTPPRMGSRKNSDVSLAGRALALEEGRIHRLGQKVRQDLIETSSPSGDKPLDSSAWAEGSRMDEMVKKMTETSGPELRELLERSGWEGVLENLGANLEELKQLQMKDPLGWEQFKESQLKAFANKRIGLPTESAVE